MARSGPKLFIFMWISICFVFVSQADADGCKKCEGPEHELYTDLFKGYMPDSRPVRNASHAVVVTFALSFNQLLDLDEKNQVLTTSLWIFEEWKDELLTWKPEEYYGQKSIMIPATSIWLPDIFIFNTASDGMDGFVNVNGSKVAVQHDGQVRWMVPLMVSSTCSVDVTYFPYDRQSCDIKFGSWIYDNRQLDIKVDSSEPDLEHYVMNSEYDLESVSVSQSVLNSSCCPGDGNHSIVKVTLALKRKSLYYDYIVIAPTIMLCVLTLASFLLPCDRGEKMAIGLTVFLTLYVLQLRIADNVPDTNSTPILGIFMLIVMTFNCVSLIMAAIVMNIKKRGDDVTCPEVPGWLFALAHHVFGRIVCTRFLWAGEIDTPPGVPPHKTGLKAEETEGTKLKNLLSNIGKSPLWSNPKFTSGDPYFRSMEGNIEMKRRKGGFNNGKGRSEWRSGRSDGKDGTDGTDAREETSLLTHDLIEDCVCSQDKMQKNTSAKNPCLRQPVESVNDSLETERLLSQESQSFASFPDPTAASKEVDRVYMMKSRWFYVAEVVDKFSFLVYLVLLTTSIFTVLFLIPVYFRND